MICHKVLYTDILYCILIYCTNNNTIEIILYIIIATIASYWMKIHLIAHNILETVLLRDPTDLQQSSLCLAIWLSFLGFIFMIFHRSMKFARR